MIAIISYIVAINMCARVCYTIYMGEKIGELEYI